LIQGEVLRGVLLLAFGAGVISSVDNFLRALIVGERTELHPMAVFLSVLGGIALFGAAGVFLGPVLFVVSVSMIEMTRAALDAEARPGGLLGTDPLESQLSTPNGIQD
jgi:predicted PurR-regulated permease PerM